MHGEGARLRLSKERTAPSGRLVTGAATRPRSKRPSNVEERRFVLPNLVVKERKRQVDVVFEPVMVSQPMRKADRVLRAVAAKEVTLTLIGESGTGKEVLARRWVASLFICVP